MNLNDDIQIIYGLNEAGKSTLMNFIKIMFYSKITKKSLSGFRNKYSPWISKEPMLGKIEFEHNGHNYILQKTISDISASKDITFLRNQTLGETIKLGSKQEAGEFIFDMDLLSFERSSFIQDVGKSNLEKSKSNSEDSILNKIINLTQTGESDLCATKAKSRIDKAIKNLNYSTKSESIKKGRIFDIEKEIQELKRKIENLNNINIKNSELSKEALNIESLIEEKNKIEDKLEEVNNSKNVSILKELINKLEEKEKLLKDLKSLDINSIDDVLHNAEIIKKDIEIQEIKCTELKKNIDNLIIDNVFTISDKEIENLNLKLKEKDNLKEKINQFKNCFDLENLKNQNLEKIDQNEFKNNYNLYLKNKGQIDKLNNQVNLCDFNTEKPIENLKLKNILSYIGIILIILSGVIFCFINIFKTHIKYQLILTSLHVLILFYLFNKNKKIKTEVLKIEKEKFEYLNIKNELKNLISYNENLKSDMINFLNKEIQKNEEKISILENDIIKILDVKNSISIENYKETYYKSKNIESNKMIYSQSINTLEKLKSEFIKYFSKYNIFENYDTALKFNDEINSKKEKINKLENEISNYTKIINPKSSDISYLKNQVNTLNLTDSINSLDFDGLENLKNRLLELKSLNLEDSYIKIKQEIKIPENSFNKISENLKLKENDLIKMKNYLESLNVASKIMEKSLNDFRSKFSDELDKESSNIFNKLTNKKYKNIYIEKNYDILVEDNMIQRNYTDLSSGTIDQAYLSLRIAISKIISKISLPLILDDTLVRYDLVRLENTINFLKENSKDMQTIIFTCHSYITNLADKNKIPVINL